MKVVDSLLRHHITTPDRVAFHESSREITYRDLFIEAERISRVLTYYGVRRGDRVALLLPRGIDSVCAIFGTLLTCGCYAPLDISNPETRLSYIVNDLQPRCIIGLGAKPKWCEDFHAKWLDISDMAFSQGSLQPDVDIVAQSDAEDLAAILYTSGSTGNPKGVCISCRAIDSFVTWSADAFCISASDRIASLTPFHFDLSLFDLFTVIHCGACTSFMPQTLTLAPKKLVSWLEESKITTWYTVPSILAFLAIRGGLTPESLPAMKQILFAGEVFPIKALTRLAEALVNTDLFNLFGPTETNVCTFWKVDRNRLQGMGAIPIGTSAGQAKLSIGESGELLVDGPCLMSGYWQAGTLQVFVGKWYCTGDLVSYNDRGELLYHGRMDRMIKSSGYRIEPAEVEAMIDRFEGVVGSVVFGEADSISGSRIVAVIAGDSIDLDALRRHLKSNLAPYMQPYRLVQVEVLPRLSNGKIDLKAIEEVNYSALKDGACTTQ
ncbi:MAG: amino acid adenylation domain-containing protein [Candidatus Thiodiazotropha sp.]